MNRTVSVVAVGSFVCLLSAAIYAAQNPAPTSVNSQPIYESCADLHDTYLRRFESAPGFGVSRMVQPPMLDRRGVVALGRKSYSIETIELVGLLKLDRAVAYVPLWHGSRPDGFSGRSLSAFETRSLDEFRSGRNVTVADDDGSGTLQCVGSLRMKDSCMNCHRDKKAGDLVGAFTYRLRVVQRP